MATGKRRQTFEKMNRERRVREKRALKAEKRELRRLGPPVEETPADETIDAAAQAPDELLDAAAPPPAADDPTD